MIEECITLLQFKGIGNQSAKKLLDEFQNKFKMNTLDFLKKTFPDREYEWNMAYDHAKEVINTCGETGITIHTIYDETYPIQLKSIKNAPLVLYSRGEVIWNKPCAAVVGTRNITPLGKEFTKQFTSHLMKDYVIVSGLALGTDTIAHKTGIKNTIAVLAHGLDTILPKSNSRLAEEIIEQGGMLVSEYPPGTKVERSNYLARNRIQAGLSQLVMIMELGEKSGTMTTARRAIEYDRPLLVFDHPKLSEAYRLGKEKAILMGGTPVNNPNKISDIITRKNIKNDSGQRQLNNSINSDKSKSTEKSKNIIGHKQTSLDDFIK